MLWSATSQRVTGGESIFAQFEEMKSMNRSDCGTRDRLVG
jgi:hypothetical protein